MLRNFNGGTSVEKNHTCSFGSASGTPPRTTQHPQEAISRNSRIMVLGTSTEVPRLRKTIHVALDQQLPIHCLSCSTPRRLSRKQNHGPGDLNRGTAAEKHNWRAEACSATSTEVPRFRKTIHVALYQQMVLHRPPRSTPRRPKIVTRGKPSTRLPSTGTHQEDQKQCDSKSWSLRPQSVYLA